MARKTKANKKTIKKKPQSVKSVEFSSNKFPKDISSQIKLGESYVSLVLGAVVVLGISVVFFLFIKGNGLKNTTPVINEANIPLVEVPVDKTTYVLQDGEGLWDVAVKFYGDGFKWMDIAKANGLENNPDNIAPGMKLVIPKAQ